MSHVFLLSLPPRRFPSLSTGQRPWWLAESLGDVLGSHGGKNPRSCQGDFPGHFLDRYVTFISFLSW